MRPVNVWCNNVSLRDLDGRVLVRTVNEQTPQAALAYADNPGRDGQRLLSRVRENRRITVSFAVRELYDLAARARVVERVNAWAQDGELRVSYRPERRIAVTVAARAGISDPRDYNEAFKIELDAAASPYWEDVTPQRLTLSGSSGSGSIRNLGSAMAYPVISVTPSGALSNFYIEFGGKNFALTNLGVSSGTPLRIGHDGRGFLFIKTAAASKLGCRQRASDDELIAAPGLNAVYFSANTSCQVDLEVYSAWL